MHCRCLIFLRLGCNHMSFAGLKYAKLAAVDQSTGHMMAILSPANADLFGNDEKIISSYAGHACLISRAID